MHYLISVLLLTLALPSYGQGSPRKILNALFDGMRSGDTVGLAALFYPEATLQSVGPGEDGRVTVQSTPIPRWLNGIAKARPGSLDERLHYAEIRIDGELATAWTPYAFILNGDIHHCGTNAFQLARLNGSWRILHVTDTRRTENCTIPPAASPGERIDSLATHWHAAAARADSAAFFGAMAPGAIYIGTDPGEHWTKEEFLEFAAPYFAAGKAWSFTATERNFFYDSDQAVAYWDELLDTWMGTCRGTGIAKRTNGEWKIVHYTLSLTVPNEDMEAVRKVIAGDN
jgi:hypothetical protein